MGFLRFSIVLFLCSWLSIAGAADFSPADSPQDLTTRLRAILKDHDVPGLIGTIVEGDQVVWKAAIGVADRDAEIAVTNDSLFRVGSISSLVTSLTALRLLEADKLSLDAPVAEYFSDNLCDNPWQQQSPVLLKHTLEQTAGYDDVSPAGFAQRDPVSSASPLDALQFNQRACASRWQPGSRYAFSHLGAVVAAAVIEQVANNDFESVVESEVFQPLNMPRATYFPDENIAASYSSAGNVIHYHRYQIRPSYALNVSWQDMAQLLKMLNARGQVMQQAWLNENSITQMETPTSTLAAQQGLALGYGLGNDAFQTDNGFIFRGHEGAIEGFHAVLGYLPEAGKGFFFAINKDDQRTFNQIKQEIIAFLTRDLAPPQANLESNKAADSDLLHAVSGYYQPAAAQQQLLAGLERLVFVQVSEVGKGLEVKPLFAPAKKYQQTEGAQFINTADGNALPDLIFMDIEPGKWHAQWQNNYYEPVSEWLAWSRIVAMFGALALIASGLLLGVLKLARKLMGSRTVRFNRVWGLPFSGSLLVLLAAGLYALSLTSVAAQNLGQLSALSATIWLASVLIPVIAIVSLITVLRRYFQRAEFGCFTWWHALLTSIALCVIAGFFLDWGWVGLRTWLH